MGNTRDTGYLRELVTYDGSNNVTFPANVSLVAPASSDNSTKVPSTAWVRTYVSGVASLSTSGTSGANGSSGSSGQTGAAGSSGSSGQTGAAGSSGSSGSSGQTGAAGSSGSSGQSGAAGSSGSSGSSGQTGAAGSSGSSGQTGAAGSSGSSGQSGAAGSSGSSGSSGTRGSSGSSGSSGQSGAAGSSGSSGQSGAAGSSGSSGQTGGAGSSGTSGTSPSAAAYVAKAGDTMTGTLRFTDSTNGIYKSGDRLTIRSESTDNVANFANYGLYLPVLSQTAGLYVESPIEARTGLRMGSGAANGTITVGADTAATANRLAQRDSNGDITVRELVLNVAVQDFTPSSMVAIYPATNQAVKVTASGARAFLSVPTRTGGDASGTWGISISGNATNLSGAGGSYIQSTSTGTSYTANYQIRENSGGGGNTNEIYAPQLGFHWSGVVASSIMMEASGRIAIRNNPGGSYESFIASDITASSNLTARSNTISGASGGVINLGGSSSDPSSLGNSGIIGLTWGLRTDSQAYYMVKSTSQSFGSYTYNRLDLSWHTGIIMGAEPVYGGIRMYNNSLNVATGILFSVGNGDSNVRATNDIIAYASDRRLKHSILPIENALSKVNSLTGMTYQWNDVGSKHGWDPDTVTREAGVFAQDVQAVLPEAVRLAPFDDEMGVSKSGENFLTVKYEKLVPLLIEAIKEQQTQIEDQALEIRNLKALVGSLLGKNLK